MPEWAFLYAHGKNIDKINYEKSSRRGAENAEKNEVPSAFSAPLRRRVFISDVFN
jgi:hypothetical protein